MNYTIDVSSSLKTANAQLRALREAIQTRRLCPQGGPTTVSKSTLNCVQLLPSHLGWESTAVTAVLRRQPPTRPTNRLPEFEPDKPTTTITDTKATITLHPALALAMLRQKQTAPGRLWLLLKHLDHSGQGWLPHHVIKAQLTTQSTPLRLCGWRQMRSLLRQGEGLFWQRDKERVWLRSTAKVAVALNLSRLTGYPVAMPVVDLLGTIGAVRAHLYASFHSGRKQARPIARCTLKQLSGVGRRTQQAYEKRAGIEVQRNFAIGEIANPVACQNRAWQQGTAVFQLKDYNGQQGPKGVKYLAWQLPNSYHSPQTHLSRGTQRRLNRTITGLFKQGITGNGDLIQTKRYYANGKQAVKGHREDTRYWLGRKTITCQLWHVT